jgi:hypothetical protein
MSQGNTLYSYLEQTKVLFVFFKNGEQEGKMGHSGEGVPVGGRGTI